MSHEAEARRGQEAKQILENPIYAEAYAGIRSEIITAWEQSRIAADREQLHAMLGLLAKVQTAMAAVMRSGEVADAELARKKSKLERMQDTLSRRFV